MGRGGGGNDYSDELQQFKRLADRGGHGSREQEVPAKRFRSSPTEPSGEKWVGPRGGARGPARRSLSPTLSSAPPSLQRMLQEQQEEQQRRNMQSATATETESAAETAMEKEQQSNSQPIVISDEEEDNSQRREVDEVEVVSEGRRPRQMFEMVSAAVPESPLSPPPLAAPTLERTVGRVPPLSPPPLSTSSGPVFCRLCDNGKPYRTAKDLSVHLTFIHYREKIMRRIKSPYECYLCKFTPPEGIDASSRADELLMHYGCEEGVAYNYYQLVSFIPVQGGGGTTKTHKTVCFSRTVVNFWIV